MESNTSATLVAALLLAGPMAAAAQVTGPAGPGAAANGTPAAAPARRGPNDSFRPRARHLIYVTEPGSLEKPGWANGVGIVVLDANDGYHFVKRIPTWEYAASMSPEQVSGVAASPVTNMIYVAARGRLAAIDMSTDKMAWSTTLDGKCQDRPRRGAGSASCAIPPDEQGGDQGALHTALDRGRQGDCVHGGAD